MPKIGQFELPEPDDVTTACDICKAFSGADKETIEKGLLGGKKVVTKKAECQLYSNDCIDSTRAQILLAYFNLIKK